MFVYLLNLFISFFEYLRDGDRWLSVSLRSDWYTISRSARATQRPCVKKQNKQKNFFSEWGVSAERFCIVLQILDSSYHLENYYFVIFFSFI